MPQQLVAQYVPAAGHLICPSSWPLSMLQQLAAQYAPGASRPICPAAGPSICPSTWPLSMPQQLATQYAPSAGHSICPSNWPLSMPHIPPSTLQSVTAVNTLATAMICTTARHTTNGQTLTKSSHAIKDGVVATDFFASVHTCAPS